MNKELTSIQLASIVDCVFKHGELFSVPTEKGKAKSFVLHEVSEKAHVFRHGSMSDTDNMSETFQDLRDLFKKFVKENE